MKFQCDCCEKYFEIDLDELTYQKWRQGDFLSIIELAPHLHSHEVDLILTGICPKCWKGIDNDNLKEAIDEPTRDRLV